MATVPPEISYSVWKFFLRLRFRGKLNQSSQLVLVGLSLGGRCLEQVLQGQGRLVIDGGCFILVANFAVSDRPPKGAL